ncbi:hypothetical protein [Photorhabdus hindustanensis]|uniref:Uncharacterized protein n=1 Tax=Photorhabdus hindustanensis TaxID=2918802 RepID=A0A2S8PVK1_9GAMM|nr:hypothetical protein [Photorhabdus hindustanensis]PQQ22900.1 hypothetical protein C6H66_21650 [Photorhabdus hindustanensis]
MFGFAAHKAVTVSQFVLLILDTDLINRLSPPQAAKQALSAFIDCHGEMAVTMFLNNELQK